jgi:hypothetical protein
LAIAETYFVYTTIFVSGSPASTILDRYQGHYKMYRRTLSDFRNNKLAAIAGEIFD